MRHGLCARAEVGTEGVGMSIRRGTATDMPGIFALLEAAHLPTADLADASAVEFWVCDGAEGVAGVVGLERCGEVGLLRSLVVDADARGRGLGAALVAAAEAAARARGIRRMLLLTQTVPTRPQCGRACG